MDEKARAQALPAQPEGGGLGRGAEPPSELQGWVPELDDSLTLAQVIDLAFDYRGNVTVVKFDGTELQGYLFNRNTDASEPFVQMFDLAGNGPSKLLYSEIRNIKFTGKDVAAGTSWAAWLERKERGYPGEGGRDSHRHRG